MWILSARVSVDNNLPTKPSHCCCPPMTAPSTLLDERASCLAHIPPPIILTSGQTYARRTCARVRCPAETDWRRWFQPPRVTTHPPPLLPQTLLPPILAVADRQNQQSTQLVSASRISQLFAPRRILGPSLGCKPNCAIPCFSELKTSLKKVVDRPTALQSQFQVTSNQITPYQILSYTGSLISDTIYMQ